MYATRAKYLSRQAYIYKNREIQIATGPQVLVGFLMKLHTFVKISMANLLVNSSIALNT